MSCVRCSTKALSVQLFCPRSVSGTGYTCTVPRLQVRALVSNNKVLNSPKQPPWNGCAGMERISVPPQFQTLIEERLEGQALRRLLAPSRASGSTRWCFQRHAAAWAAQGRDRANRGERFILFLQ